MHVALRVENLARSIEFYRKLFATEPSKVRAGYAKFEPSAPPSLQLSRERGIGVVVVLNAADREVVEAVMRSEGNDEKDWRRLSSGVRGARALPLAGRRQPCHVLRQPRLYLTRIVRDCRLTPVPVPLTLG